MPLDSILNRKVSSSSSSRALDFSSVIFPLVKWHFPERGNPLCLLPFSSALGDNADSDQWPGWRLMALIWLECCKLQPSGLRYICLPCCLADGTVGQRRQWDWDCSWVRVVAIHLLLLFYAGSGSGDIIIAHLKCTEYVLTPSGRGSQPAGSWQCCREL